MSDYHIKRKKDATRLHMNQRFHTESELKYAADIRKKKAKQFRLLSILLVVLIAGGFAVYAASRLGLLELTFGREEPKLPEKQTESNISSPQKEPEQSPKAEDSSAHEASKPSENGSSSPEKDSNSSDSSTSAPQQESSQENSAPPANTTDYTALYPELTVPKTEFVEHDPADKVIYLTFDDGPCSSTEKLLDKLDELGVKATFFVSAQFYGHDEIVKDLKEISARGNTIGVHSYTHRYRDIYSSVSAYLEDYKKMDDLIVEATGKRSTFFRFPGGSNTGYNESIRNALLTEMNRRGFVYHDWNSHNGDSEGYGPKAQVERAVREASNNSKSVILMHDTPDKGSVIDVLPDIVGQLKDKGYRFDVIDETVRPFRFATVD